MTDTTIKTGNVRVAHFSGTKNSDGATVTFDAPVSVTIDNPAVATYTDINGVSGSFAAVGAGTANFVATATAGGVSATVSGVITVALADDGSFVLSVTFDEETKAA